MKPAKVVIVVLQRGWIAVGRLHRFKSKHVLRSAYVVRRWGTKNGLGELAANGPGANTVLDPAPEVSFHPLTAVLTIPCAEEKWADRCKQA